MVLYGLSACLASLEATLHHLALVAHLVSLWNILSLIVGEQAWLCLYFWIESWAIIIGIPLHVRLMLAWGTKLDLIHWVVHDVELLGDLGDLTSQKLSPCFNRWQGGLICSILRLRGTIVSSDMGSIVWNVHIYLRNFRLAHRTYKLDAGMVNNCLTFFITKSFELSLTFFIVRVAVESHGLGSRGLFPVYFKVPTCLPKTFPLKFWQQQFDRFIEVSQLPDLRAKVSFGVQILATLYETSWLGRMAATALKTLWKFLTNVVDWVRQGASLEEFRTFLASLFVVWNWGAAKTVQSSDKEVLQVVVVPDS